MNDNSIFKELKEVLLENKYSQKDIAEIERAFEYSNNHLFDSSFYHILLALLSHILQILI